ncbi:uncharacterized protein BX664DRAFT_292804 [Halteromyces radiatus]|uniref:uncharacterized protein n=1 Tax=Halteromyces radiatus TaxID=101107 RepID=UPI00222109C6|nr:uncharacterized protein BX664DRAFT_292804 [Halteromyces radiatus]KAI8097323.1 hypothetical protein BX664DRAFT_292804 [Halteromyces radiatus]
MAPNTPSRPTYIRVKRDKTIVFLCIKLDDTILNIKEKLVTAMSISKPVEDLRLYLDTTSEHQTLTGRVLEDHQTAKSAELVNDALVYLVYFDHNLGKWEDIHVVEYESLDDEIEEDTTDLTDESTKKKEKGKGRA